MEIINYNKVVYKTIDGLDEKNKQHIIELNVAYRSDSPKKPRPLSMHSKRRDRKQFYI